MGTKNGTTGTDSGTTVESIIGNFNESQINQVTDSGVRQTAMACRTLASGIAEVSLSPEDPAQELIAASLEGRNITLDDVGQLIADGESLLAACNDRVARRPPPAPPARAPILPASMPTTLCRAPPTSSAGCSAGSRVPWSSSA